MIEGVFYIESQGNDEGVVKKALKDMLDKMKTEKGVSVRKTSYGDVVKENGNYSFTVEVDVSFDGFKDYLMTAMKYGPSAITLEAPEKLKMGSQEFLTTLAEITAFTKRVLEKYGIYFTFPEPKNEVKIGLDEDEIDALLDQGALRVKIVVEREEDEEEAQMKFLGAMGKEVFVHKVKTSKLEDRTLVAVHAFMYEPRTLINLSIKHSPILIELLGPEELALPMFDIQDIGVELAATYFEMAHHTLYRSSPS
jgi:hypothetical protein